MAGTPKPPEDKEFMNHDPAAVPVIGRHDGGCSKRTELRHDHPQFGPDMSWECTRTHGHLGRHGVAVGSGMACSWAQKV